MRGKLLFVSGIAVGYVLGARAGRKRYEQIKSAAESVWNTPTVQKGVDSAKGFASARVGDVADSLLDGVKKLISTATAPQKQRGGHDSAPSAASRVAPVKAPAPTTSDAPVADPSAPAAAGGKKKTTAKAAPSKTGPSSDSE